MYFLVYKKITVQRHGFACEGLNLLQLPLQVPLQPRLTVVCGGIMGAFVLLIHPCNTMPSLE